MQDTDEVAAKLAEWKKILDEIRGQLQRSDEAFQALGFDPEKVRAAIDASLGPKEREEVERLVAKDMADVEREVEQARARLGFNGSRSRIGKKQRSMV